MKATLLDDRLTPLTAQEVIRAFREAYRTLGALPADITPGTLAIFVAQSALETGRWKSLHWCNFGNIKAGVDYEGFYTLFRCNEVIDGKVKWFDPPHPQCRFRAYPDATAGARDYLQLLRTRKRFAPAWNAAHHGDASEFVEALKRGGYFTADLGPYRRAVLSLTNEFRQVIAEMGPETERPPAMPVEPEHSATSDEDMGLLLPLVWDTEEHRRDRDEAVKETT